MKTKYIQRGYCEECGLRTTRKINDKWVCKKCSTSSKEELNLVISDIHIPYHDQKAVDCMFQFIKDHKPDRVIINGDLIDFYSLSRFDKCPDRKNSLQDELDQTIEFLDRLRSYHKGEIIFLHGNHEDRLQKYLWYNPEFHELDCLKTRSLLKFDEYDIKEITVNGEYWSAEKGEILIGDTIIMHGDGRLNGAKFSANPGATVLSTMKGKGNNVIMGHCHRLALVYNKIGDKYVTGIEGGCLCVQTRGNWQQGFSTFTSFENKSYNYNIYRIINGKLE